MLTNLDFFVWDLSKKTAKWMASELYDEFNEGKPKTSLAKYNFAELQHPHRRLYLRLLGSRPYTLLYVKKGVCG